MLEQDQFTLKQLRGLSGMTQEELAGKVGVTSRTIANYETGKSTLADAPYSRIRALAEALDVSVDHIFLDSTSEKPE